MPENKPEYKAATRVQQVMRFHCSDCGAVLGEYGRKNDGQAMLVLPGWVDVKRITGKCANCGNTVHFQRTDILFDRLMDATARRQLTNDNN